jgi:cell division septation protein DedD
MANSGQSEAAPSAKQLVFLAMMATVVAVVVFLCGVLVGRGVPLQRGTVAQPSEAGPGRAGVFGIGEPAPDADTDAASPLDDLSYYERLSGTDPVPERELTRTEVVPAGETDGADAVPPERFDAAAPVAPAGALSGSRDAASFVVQVTAVRGADDAHAVAAGLLARGYPAFVVDPVPGAPAAVYRVRVGPYPDRAEAETVRLRLETEEQFKPWVIQA